MDDIGRHFRLLLGRRKGSQRRVTLGRRAGVTFEGWWGDPAGQNPTKGTLITQQSHQDRPVGGGSFGLVRIDISLERGPNHWDRFGRDIVQNAC